MNEIPTYEQAMLNAARLLNNAEMETDLAKMQRLESLADSWIGIAGIIMAKDANI